MLNIDYSNRFGNGTIARGQNLMPQNNWQKVFQINWVQFEMPHVTLRGDHWVNAQKVYIPQGVTHF